MPEENKNDGTDEDQGSGTPPPLPQSFTQDDVTRIAAREKDQGKRQGSREALEALGLSSIEEATQLKEALDAAAAAEQSDLDRANAKAAKAEADLKAERAIVAQERFAVSVERALQKEGAPLDQIGKIAKLVDAEVGSDSDMITTAVADLKAEMPQLFSSPGSEGDGEKPPPGTPKQPAGTDPGGQRKGSTPPDPKSSARSRLEARHGDRLKSTN